MEKRIPGVRIEQAKNAQHDEYMRDVVAQAQECQGVTQLLPAQLAALKAASDFEHQCIVRPLKSQYTQAITDKDRERDDALGKLRAAMWAATGNPDANTARAAQYIWEMCGIQKISSSMQYDEQTGKISAMMTLLLGQYLTYTEASGVKAYVTRLKTLNDEMCELLQLRDAERGEEGPKQTAEARTATDRAYRELVYAVNCVSFTIDAGLLNVSARMGESSTESREEIYNPFTPFINFMLGHIERYNREILNRKPGSLDDSENSEDTETSETEETETTTTEEEETLTRK